MIIGIDASRALTTRRTGTEAYALFLIRALLSPAQARGHTVRLYVNAPPGAALPFDLTPPHTAVYLPFPRVWTHARLAWELQQHSPDVFFTPAHVIPATYSGRSVATVHDLGYRYFPEAHTAGQRWYLRWSTRHNARRSRRVVVDSAETRADLIDAYHTPSDRITVIYPGRDPDLQRAAPAAIPPVLRAYGITPPYLLYLGTLQPRKNLARLIAAFAQVSDRLPHQLVLAGQAGWLAHPILDAVAQQRARLGGRLLLPGYIPDAHKAALLSGADALVYPSLHEGFGFPVVEAQQCGTPVLCADASSLPEVAGEGALLVDPCDSAALAAGLVRITTDNVLRARLVNAGYANIRRFDWQQAAAQLLALLEADDAWGVARRLRSWVSCH